MHFSLPHEQCNFRKELWGHRVVLACGLCCGQNVPGLCPAAHVLLLADEDWQLLSERRVFPMSLFNERMLQQMRHWWTRLKILYQTPADKRRDEGEKYKRRQTESREACNVTNDTHNSSSFPYITSKLTWKMSNKWQCTQWTSKRSYIIL